MTDIVDGVIPVDISRLGLAGTFRQCQSWSDTEACDSQRAISEKRQVAAASTFREGLIKLTKGKNIDGPNKPKEEQNLPQKGYPIYGVK